MASAVARASNGGLGAVPPVGSRGKAPGRGVRGLRPLKLTTFLHLKVNLTRKIASSILHFMQSIMLQFLRELC